jgi:hypothetical protein
LSDRLSTIPIGGITGQVAPDQVPQIVKHLKLLEEKYKKIESVDLFLHSAGGDVNTAWPLVNVIRNYSEKFNVLIPVKAHSAATLISLGADTIVMSKTASISPVDPTVANAFNPKENNHPKGISVEDVTSFLALAKESEFNISSEEYVTEVFKLLAKEIHPLALGNVKRSHSQIRELATKLLRLHIKPEDASVDEIVKGFTEILHSHYHSIFINEAQSMGMKNIVKSDAEEEDLFWKLFKDYESEMHLNKIFDANVFMGDDNEKNLETVTTFIECSELSSKYIFKQKLVKALVADPAHRLNVLNTQTQLTNNCRATKAQVMNIEASVRALQSQITNGLQGNPQALAVINGQFNGIVGEIVNVKNSINEDIDVSSLKLLIEPKIKEIGWNN